jgi:hypothetical protein
MLNSRSTVEKPITPQPPHLTKQFCTPAKNRELYIYIYLNEGGEVVSLTHRPPLPQECSWYSFLLGAESTPGPWCGRKEICP